MYYGPQIFMVTGFSTSKRDALLASIPAASANMIGTLVAISFVEKSGRRKSALITLPIMAFFLIGIGISFYFTEFEKGGDVVNYCIIMFVILFVLAFSLSMGAIPWVVNSEIYPVRFR